jgi:hypothetical protein
VPQDLAPGEYPIVMTAGGASTSPNVTIAVQ